MNSKCYLKVVQSNGISRKCRLVVNNEKKSLILNNEIPLDYQKVEYIQSVGTSCRIDTGVKANLTKNTRIEGKFLVPSLNYRHIFFGTYTNGFNFNLELNNTGKIRIYHSTDIAFSTNSVPENQEGIVTYTYNPITHDVSASFDNVSVSANTTSAGVSGNTIALFDDWRTTPGSTFYPMRCYYYKHYENDALVCNLIPCYNKESGTIGMFDTVSNQFRMNCGTGDFIKGSDI